MNLDQYSVHSEPNLAHQGYYLKLASGSLGNKAHQQHEIQWIVIMKSVLNLNWENFGLFISCVFPIDRFFVIISYLLDVIIDILYFMFLVSIYPSFFLMILIQIFIWYRIILVCNENLSCRFIWLIHEVFSTTAILFTWTFAWINFVRHTTLILNGKLRQIFNKYSEQKYEFYKCVPPSRVFVI